MLKKIYISLGLACCCTLGYSQGIFPSVIGPGGGSSTTGGYRIDYTIGEMAIQTAGNGPIITEGFEQPEMGDASLPVQDLKLQVSIDKGYALLSFSTRQEFKSDHFIAESSVDGLRFDTLAFIKTKAMGGYSAVPLYYAYIDPVQLKGTVYYRIAQVDQNGDYMYSSVQSISARLESALKVFPNPATSQIEVQIGNRSNNTRIQVYSASGVLMYSNKIPGKSDTTIQVAKWPAGIYLLVVNTDGVIQKTKFIKK